MKRCLMVATLVACAAGCAPPGPKGGLTSGQRQTDNGGFGQTTTADSTAGAGVPVGPPEVALYERKGAGGQGLIVAAWSDGTVVFASRVDAPGADLRIGKSDSVRVSRVIELCSSAGLGSKAAAIPAADAPQRAVGIRVHGSDALSRAWPVGAVPSPQEADAVNSCEFCAARAIALIPFDGGRGFGGTRAWTEQIEKFAQTGKWDGGTAK